jgi:methanogenic corrinoid protein MtbC1
MENNLLENLKQAIFTYNNELAINIANEIIEKKIDPIKSMDAMMSAIRDVGEKFGRGELWFPELMGAASAMKKAMQILEEELTKKKIKRKNIGVVVIGTVYD